MEEEKTKNQETEKSTVSSTSTNTVIEVNPISKDPIKEEKEEIIWKTDEFTYHAKSVDWYWYFGLIVVILMAISVYLHNTMFAFVIAIGAFTMSMYTNKHPREIEYKANKKGITFDGLSYPYRDILYFTLIDDKKQSAENLLLLQLKKTNSVIVIIPLGEVGVDELHTFLLNFIEEKEMAVPLGYTFMNLIGF